MRIGGLKTLVPFLLLLGLGLALAYFIAPGWGPASREGEPSPEAPGPTWPPPFPDSAPPVPDAEPASLTGHVRGKTGPPGAGAWVMLSGLSREIRANLDQQGNFAFTDVPAGVPLDLWIGPDPSGSRICRLAEGLVLKPGEHRFLEVAAEFEVAIRGQVVDDAGRPLENVRVAVLPPLADWRTAVPIAASTGPDGRFYVGFEGKATPDRMRLVIDHVAEGFILEERLVAPRAASAREVRIKLKPGLTIAGQVLLPNGAPLVGAEVRLLEEYEGDVMARRPSQGLVKTDEEGRFRDDAYRPGVYRIFVAGESGGRRFGVVKDGVIAGREDLEIRFPGFGSVKIAFEDEITGAAIEVARGDLEYIYGHTGEEEHYECWQSLERASEFDFPALPEGHYRVRVSTLGYEPLFSPLIFVKAGVDLGLIRYRLKPLR